MNSEKKVNKKYNAGGNFGGRRGNPDDKAKDFIGSIKKLLRYNRPFITLICIALVLSMFSSILSIIGPDKLKDMTNIITEGIRSGIDLNKIKHIGLLLVTFYSLSFIFYYIQGIIMASVTNHSAKKMRSDISNKINKLPLSYFDKTTVGDVLSRVTNDVDSISQNLNQSVTTLASACTMFIGSLIMMFVTNWLMAITAIMSSILGFIFMTLILKKSQKYFTAVQNELGDINGHIEEVYSGHTVVKLYNATDEVSTKFNDINEKLFVAGKKSQFYSGLMQPLMVFVGNFGYVAVCVVGALLTMNGTISFGVIVAFMIYVRLFTQPLSQLAQSMTGMQSTAAASERVFEFLEEEEMVAENTKTMYLDPTKVKGDIEFRNVEFGYIPDKVIIKDFTAKIKAGQKIAIVGPTGAGKTTIVNLLMKFYNINKGDILIDNVSTKDLTRENVHELFIMVLQDTWLFEGSIKDNIRYNNENVSDEKIAEACKVVGLDHFIKTLPKGYDTILGDTESLSAGQKQLLTIARGMIKNSPFLIFDEATSSVDTRTEVLVGKAMDKLTKGRTSFIIAHRLSTIKNADLILVLQQGNIVEQGNHKELLAQNGVYAELYNSQFQNFN